MLASKPMMAMTTSSSIKVNASVFLFLADNSLGGLVSLIMAYCAARVN
jgi:hypothetical protein